MRRMRRLFAVLAFATLGPLGCVVGDTGSEDETPVLEEAYSSGATCIQECDLYMSYCLNFPTSCPECDQSNWSVQNCIAHHQSCLLACPPQPDCSCQNGSYCCRNSNGTFDCTPQGTCGGGGGGDGGGDGGGGGGGYGGCDDDWDCPPAEECTSWGNCVPLGCG